MGLKSGSRDAGLDDSEDDAGGSEATPTEPPASAGSPGSDGRSDAGPAEQADSTDDVTGVAGEEVPDEDDGTTEDGAGRPTMESLPYTLRRDKVNEGREQVPFFLREAVVDGEDDLRDALEERLGEDVYKSDYREASMVVAQRNPELVAEVLREWGYDYDYD